MHRTIGVLLEDLADPFSGVLHRAVEEEARTRGARVLAGGPAGELAHVLQHCRADGLIVVPSGADQSYLARFAGTPIVCVDRPPTGFETDAVVSTNVAGAAAAVRHLTARGHRRIAYLGGHQDSPTARDRFRGYRQALGDRPGPVVHDLDGESTAERATLALLRRPDAPTALFAGHDPITRGAVRALRRADRHRSVALVGFDDFPLADLLEPAVTVVAQDAARMGRVAVGTLFERIDGHEGPPREIRVPTTLVPRGSGEIPTGS